MVHMIEIATPIFINLTMFKKDSLDLMLFTTKKKNVNNIDNSISDVPKVELNPKKLLFLFIEKTVDITADKIKRKIKI